MCQQGILTDNVRHDRILVDELSVTAGVSLRMTCLCKNGQRRTMATFGVG